MQREILFRGKPKNKAWLVRGDFFATVVFAENRNKAKQIAMSTVACEDVPYINIEACRLPIADSQYKEGKDEMDWNDPDDRIFLVKNCDFHCEYIKPYECSKCSAKDYCSMLEYWNGRAGNGNV